MSFDGFPHEAFTWFEGLEAHNSKAYFTAHRDTYERAVRGPLEELLEAFADELGGRVKVFRQHRDIRFSPDKSPYKTRTYGVVGDRPSSLPGSSPAPATTSSKLRSSGASAMRSPTTRRARSSKRQSRRRMPRASRPSAGRSRRRRAAIRRITRASCCCATGRSSRAGD
jgi:hypothetical protein